MRLRIFLYRRAESEFYAMFRFVKEKGDNPNIYATIANKQGVYLDDAAMDVGCKVPLCGMDAHEIHAQAYDNVHALTKYVNRVIVDVRKCILDVNPKMDLIGMPLYGVSDVGAILAKQVPGQAVS